MSLYTVYDFSESLDRISEFGLEDIAKVLLAWGNNRDSSEWEGGFVVQLKDDRIFQIQGWCDYTGWGCQDGVEVKAINAVPKIPDADVNPTDLNRYIEGKINDWGEPV